MHTVDGVRLDLALTVDFDSSVPLYRQIADEVRSLVARGLLEDSAELPGVRALGARLGVNLNTVAKAYRTLAEEGLVELKHGSRARVRLGERPADATPADELARRLDHLLGRLRLHGASRAQVEELCARAVERYFPQGEAS